MLTRVAFIHFYLHIYEIFPVYEDMKNNIANTWTHHPKPSASPSLIAAALFGVTDVNGVRAVACLSLYHGVCSYA